MRDAKTLARQVRIAENARMTDAEFELLRTQLRDTTRTSAPPDEEASGWVLALDTAGGPDRWLNAALYFAVQAETCRRRGIPES